MIGRRHCVDQRGRDERQRAQHDHRRAANPVGQPAGKTRGQEPTLGQSIIVGLKEAVAWSRGEGVRARTTTVQVPKVDVQRVRRKMRLSQDEFAAKFGFAAASVRNWEQGRRQPEGPARVLLAVIDRHPEVVEEVLQTSK
ncbi:MAG TPA: type II toxin-antitoxin system MqsA family antitoxin [Chloroflexota bacterium]